MTTPYDKQAPKKATNVSINSDLLEKARACKINLSATLEQALVERLRVEQGEEWKRQNRAAIVRYNQTVEELGVFSDGLRRF